MFAVDIFAGPIVDLSDFPRVMLVATNIVGPICSVKRNVLHYLNFRIAAMTILYTLSILL